MVAGAGVGVAWMDDLLDDVVAEGTGGWRVLQRGRGVGEGRIGKCKTGLNVVCEIRRVRCGHVFCTHL